jgi:hypothetical protein
MGGGEQGSGAPRRRAWSVLFPSLSALLFVLLAAASSAGGTTPSKHAATLATVSRSGLADSGPPVRVLLLGDSTALTLGEGLGEPSTEHAYDYVLSDDGIVGCGVADGPETEVMGQEDTVGPACDGAPAAPGASLAEQPWPVQWRWYLAISHPNVVAVLAGRWEVLNRVYEGRWTDILQPTFAAYVKSQLELAADLVAASGAHLVFLTAPCISEAPQPDGAPWPEENPARLAAYNKLVRAVAAEHPGIDSVADLDRAACPGGRYVTSEDSVTIRSVTDGIHFSPAGGVVLAPYVMPEIVAAGRAQMASSGS